MLGTRLVLQAKLRKTDGLEQCHYAHKPLLQVYVLFAR